MSVKDHAGFYQAGAKALKRLADRCGQVDLARFFEHQAERFLLMADVCAQRAAAAPPPQPVPAKRPVFSRRNLPGPRVAGPTNVVDLSSARARRQS